MTKISSKTAYPKKKPISSDYFVGTDSEDFNKTVNFGFEEVAGLVNKLNGTPLLNYVFSTSPYLSTEVLLEGRFLSDENELSTPLLTKLYVNKFNNSGDNLQELYLFLQANATDFYLKLRNSNNQNNAVYFDISSIEDFPDYFILNITVFKENEFLPLLENLNVYFFDFELKATATGTSDPLKLDKASYTGNAKDLDNRIIALENSTLPDVVLKNGEVIITGNVANISVNDFQWRLNQVDYLITPAYSTTIANATAGYYRSDLIVGDNTGNYSLVQGVEDNLAAPEPLVPVGKIKLALIPVFGSTVSVPPLLPNYDDKFLKRYKSTYKTSKPIFNLMPYEDDYNVIFNGTTDSEIRIWENGYSGNFIKNGAIYPFKNMGTGIVSVWSNVGVTVNAPNGLILTYNQQCYLIKDDYNEWTLINPVSSFSGETAASIKEKYESNADTNAFTNALKSKLDSITEIFTTALKSSYDGVVSGYTALIATGSRLITSGEITKLGNTSGTNSGDNATNTQYSGLSTSKQDTLVSGTNIKTINGTSILGSGDIVISGGSSSATKITLTDASTTVWDFSVSPYAEWTIGGNRTLSITNLPTGEVASGVIKIIQNSTGGFTPNLSGISNDVVFRTGANDKNLLGFYWDGTSLFWSSSYGGASSNSGLTLATPTGFVASNILFNGMNLTWNAVANATGYTIERALDVFFTSPTIILSNSNVLTYSDGGLNPLTQYFYRIKANATGFNSSNWVVINATTIAGSGYVTWLDLGSDATFGNEQFNSNYGIRRKTTTNDWGNANGTAVSNQLLTSGKRVYFKINDVSKACSVILAGTTPLNSAGSAYFFGMFVGYGLGSNLGTLKSGVPSNSVLKSYLTGDWGAIYYTGSSIEYQHSTDGINFTTWKVDVDVPSGSYNVQVQFYSGSPFGLSEVILK